MNLTEMVYDDLICLAFRHRWIPHAGSAGIVAAAKVIQWELKCDGCDSTATEWRDLFGVRLPGTQRQYYYTDSYGHSTGYTQAEYIAELRKRQQGNLRNVAG